MNADDLLTPDLATAADEMRARHEPFVVATVIHALQIQGAMESVSKWALCLAVLTATGVTLLHLRVIRPLLRERREH